MSKYIILVKDFQKSPSAGGFPPLNVRFWWPKVA